MKNSLLLLFLLTSLFAGFHASAQDTCLVRTFGGPGNEIAHSLAVMPDSGFIVAGITNYYGAGGNSVYMVRTNKKGIRRWSKVLGGTQIDRCNSVVVTGDSGIYIIGYTNSYGLGGYDGLIIKTDSAGNELWTKTYGGADWDFFNNGYLLPDGSIIACGKTYSNGASRADGFAVHIDAQGNVLHTVQTGNSFDDEFKDVVSDGSNWYFCGLTHLTSSSNTTGWVLKTATDGTVLQSFNIQAQTSDEFRGIDLISNDLILAGASVLDTNPTQIWQCRLDKNGNVIWQNTYNNLITKAYFNDVVTLPNNQLTFVGYWDESGLGGSSLYMVRTDENGNWKAGPSFGGTLDEEGFEAVLVPGDKIAFCGYSTSWAIGNEDMLLVILPHDTLVMNYVIDQVYYSENLSPIYVSEMQQKTVQLFPNPSNGKVGFTMDELLISGPILLFTPTGSVLDVTDKLNGATLDLSGMTPGLYTYQLRYRNNVVNGRLVIQ